MKIFVLCNVFGEKKIYFIPGQMETNIALLLREMLKRGNGAFKGLIKGIDQNNNCQRFDTN